MIDIAYAHEGEVHDTTIESTTHFIDFLLYPHFVIPAFFVAMSLVVFLLKYFKVNPSKIALVVLFLLFGGSILGFMFVPSLGIISVILGFIFAILLSFSGIQHKQ